jgi:hypothetical protein
VLGEERAGGRGVDREVGRALPYDHRGPGDASDVRVQRVRGLEHRRRPPGTAEGEQHRLQHLVRAVGAEQPLEGLVELIGERGAQLACIAIRIPVEGRVAQCIQPRVDELLRRCVRALVRVEPYGHVELRRVVSLERA